MSATNYTPIYLYNSGTATNTPSASNLGAGELAINYADGKLFYKDGSAAVQVIAWKTTPTTAGGTGLTSYTAGDLPYYASGSALSKLGIGTANYVLTSSGTAPQYVAQSTLSVGSATNATNVGTTDNTSSSSTYYPTLVSATSGNNPITTSSTKLSFVPSTGKLTATSYGGAWAGSTIGTTYGGTGLTSFTANGVVYASSTSALATGSALQFDGANLLVGSSTSLYASGKLQISGGKTIINSTDSCFGQLQIGNATTNGEASIEFLSNVATFGTSPTSTSGNNYCWNIGAGNYSIGGDSFGIGNKGLGGINVKLAYNSSSWISVSDERIKDIQSDITNAYEIVKDWRTVYYTLKSDPLKITKIGLLAQDVQKTLPAAVDIPKTETDDKGNLNPWGVHYTDVIPVLVKAIQELSAQVTSLQATVETQATTIATLQNKIGA